MRFLYYLLFITILTSACQSNRQSNKNCALSITDSYHRTITLAKRPERIISASPAITEIIFALGQGNKLVGRTDFCKYPPESQKIPPIGGLIDPSVETIVSLNPDLMIASTHFRKEVVEQLEQLKINIVILKSQESFDGAYEMINRLASLFEVTSKGDSIVHSMKQRVNRIKDATKQISQRPSVYVVIGYGKTGDFTAGGDTFINDLIEMAGGTNIAHDIKGWSYSLEKLIEEDPDIIIIRPGDKKNFCGIKSYQNLKAVQNGKVFEINNDLFELTGPRLAEGLETLFKVIHPEMSINSSNR
jgi:iron complex transport system substrate-binding protein